MLHRECAQLLGISLHASEQQIKKAYHQLVKKYHPDINTGVSSVIFPRLTEAYNVLLDKSRAQANLWNSIYAHGNILIRDPNPLKRLEAAGYLAKYGKKSCYGYLKFGLSDADRNVVRTCIRGIRNLDFPQGGKELHSLFKRADAEIKREILSVIPSMRKHDQFRGILYTAMTEKDPFLKQEAYRIFKEIRRGVHG